MVKKHYQKNSLTKSTRRNNVSYKIFMMAAVSILLFGCGTGGYNVGFLETNPGYTRSNVDPNKIQIYTNDEALPTQKYRVIGEIRTDWKWKGMDADRTEVLREMKKKASEVGADAIISVRFVPPGVNGSGLGSGNAIVFLK